MTERAHTGHRRTPARLALSVAVAGVALALAGCGGADAGSGASESTAAPSSPATSASVSASASASAPSPEDDGGGSAAAADLPGVPLESTGYAGDPRPVDEVYHRSCLEALAVDEEVPETEGTGEDENGELNPTPWSMQMGSTLTEGWLSCPTERFGGLSVPASFDVTVDGTDGSVDGLSIADASGQQVGGLRTDVSGGAPEGAEVAEVLEVTEQPEYTGAGEETAYLRSLVVETDSGTQLMVDLVSAPAGEDPESLEVWDLGVHDGNQRDVVYGTIPLESADDTQEAAASDLHAVLREMVGSYQPAVQ